MSGIGHCRADGVLSGTQELSALPILYSSKQIPRSPASTRTDTACSRKSLVSFGVAALLAVTAAAQVTTGATGIDASGSFQQEVNACMTGKTQQDRDTCLREARNAQADKKRGVLDNAGARFQSNASARCDVLMGEEKAACQARVMGFGNATGSVAGGGLLREVETVVMPAGQSSIMIDPKTADPVVLVGPRINKKRQQGGKGGPAGPPLREPLALGVSISGSIVSVRTRSAAYEWFCNVC